MNTVLQISQDDRPSILPPGTTDLTLIDMWIGSKRSQNTRTAYRQDITEFRDFIKKKPLQLVNLADVQAYEQKLQDKRTKKDTPLTPATRNRKLAAVKGLLSFGHRNGYLLFNVGTNLQLTSLENKLAQRILSEDQVKGMIDRETNKRNHTLLRLLYHCGLRVS